jgi:hypothetical protein
MFHCLQTQSVFRCRTQGRVCRLRLRSTVPSRSIRHQEINSFGFLGPRGWCWARKWGGGGWFQICSVIRRWAGTCAAKNKYNAPTWSGSLHVVWLFWTQFHPMVRAAPTTTTTRDVKVRHVCGSRDSSATGRRRTDWQFGSVPAFRNPSVSMSQRILVFLLLIIPSAYFILCFLRILFHLFIFLSFSCLH